MKKHSFIIFVLLLLMTPGIVFSQDSEVEQLEENSAGWSLKSQWGLGVKAGLSGVGFELIKGLGDRLNLRIGYSALDIPYTLNQSFEGYDLEADIKASLGGVSGLIDFYLVKNAIHLTAGVVQNKTNIGVDIRSLSSFPYGDIEIPAEDVGVISAELGPGMSISPYIGLGFGNTLSRKRVVSFNFELGAIYQGSPLLLLNGDGIIGPMASEANQDVVNAAIAQYTWFPIGKFPIKF